MNYTFEQQKAYHQQQHWFKVGDDYARLAVNVMQEQRGLTLHYRTDLPFQYSCGETEEGYEVKKDQVWVKSRRLSIEVYKQRKSGRFSLATTWMPRPYNTHSLIQGDESALFVFEKWDLYKRIGKWPLQEQTIYPKNGSAPFRIARWFLPVEQAIEWAKDVIVLDETAAKLERSLFQSIPDYSKPVVPMIVTLPTTYEEWCCVRR
jgi:hypothetical protein